MHMGVICSSFLAFFHCGRQNASQDSVRAKSADPETSLFGFLLQTEKLHMETSSSSLHIYSTYQPNPISLLLLLFFLVNQLLNQIVQDDKWGGKGPILWQVWLDFFRKILQGDLLLVVLPTARLFLPLLLLLHVNRLVSHQLNNVVRCRQW